MLDAFSGDHPSYERNVFIAMRFRGTEQFVEIDRALRESFAKYSLTGLRADDRMYAVDGDLWNNVCVYMMGCKYAVCVFEEIDEREFNPNVGIEYGFLRAMNRQVLLLKEQRVRTMPTDMVGKMYRSFDSYKIREPLAAGGSVGRARFGTDGNFVNRSVLCDPSDLVPLQYERRPRTRNRNT